MDIEQQADALIKSFEGKVEFDEEGYQTFTIANMTLYRLFDVLSENFTLFMNWDPKRESAAHVAARLGMSKSSFLNWVQRAKGMKMSEWLDELHELEAQCYDLTSDQLGFANALPLVYTDEIPLEELTEVEQLAAKKLLGLSDEQPEEAPAQDKPQTDSQQ